MLSVRSRRALFLASERCGHTYGELATHDFTFHRITPSGLVFESVAREGEALVVSFAYGDGLRTSDGKAPSCFEIAEEDGLYYPAQATIEGSKVRLTCPRLKSPRYVRYAWQPFTRANLVNKDGLPASTFRGEVGD